MALDVRDVHQALEKWAGFPVEREPRPIVLTQMSVAELERLKRDTAWRSLFDVPGVPEAELPPELRAAALHYYRGEAQPLPAIIRAPGPFATDRGLRELPAWMMHPRDRRWPFIGLDPEFRRQMTWRPENLADWSPTEESSLAADGRTLTYRFTGTPAEYAAYPHAEVYETETAVLIDPVEVDLDGPDHVRLTYSEQREVVVHLSVPLGNRVLICAPRSSVDSEYGGAPRTVITAVQDVQPQGYRPSGL
ncbi:hypothetical protein [Actinomadura sp. WMMA1423]|uniref:hypothetical protein n=1 Tax=Actinomadura sp. WMMA1423 TaxID=2591108 RepID=UPI00197A9E00|nr:hypothetical protein [Actinomadura sp. WMMA1423]